MALNSNEVLSLKVMSLSHSSIDSQISTLSLLPTSIGNIEVNSLCIDNMFPLLLPTSQCRLYCGESFHAFLSISNSSVIKAKGVVLKVGIYLTFISSILTVNNSKVELVGTNRRHMLYNNEENYTDIDIGDSMDIILKERVDEIGLYNLTCQLFFTSNEARLTQKKSYKFAVLSPLNILHRVYHLNDNSDVRASYIEVSIENISHQSITINEVLLLPLNEDEFTDLNLQIRDLSFLNQESGQVLIHTRCKYNKIFRITTNPAFISTPSDISQDILQVDLRIGWRSKTYGDSWLNNYKISYNLHQNNGISCKGKISVRTELPSVVNKQEKFVVRLYITNNYDLERENLTVEFDSNKLLPILVLGNDKLEIKLLNVKETIVFELDCLSLSSGVYNFKGISIYDDERREVSLRWEFNSKS